MRIELSSAREELSVQVSNKAHNAQKVEARLSSLLENTKSSRAPPTQPGWVSYTLSSKSAISLTSHLSSSANTCNSSPSISIHEQDQLSQAKQIPPSFPICSVSIDVCEAPKEPSNWKCSWTLIQHSNFCPSQYRSWRCSFCANY